MRIGPIQRRPLFEGSAVRPPWSVSNLSRLSKTSRNSPSRTAGPEIPSCLSPCAGVETLSPVKSLTHVADAVNASLMFLYLVVSSSILPIACLRHLAYALLLVVTRDLRPHVVPWSSMSYHQTPVNPHPSIMLRQMTHRTLSTLQCSTHAHQFHLILSRRMPRQRSHPFHLSFLPPTGRIHPGLRPQMASLRGKHRPSLPPRQKYQSIRFPPLTFHLSIWTKAILEAVLRRAWNHVRRTWLIQRRGTKIT